MHVRIRMYLTSTTQTCLIATHSGTHDNATLRTAANHVCLLTTWVAILSLYVAEHHEY